MLDDLIWPEDLGDDDEGRRRLTRAIELANLANLNGDKPMAYLTTMLKREPCAIETSAIAEPEPVTP